MAWGEDLEWSRGERQFYEGWTEGSLERQIREDRIAQSLFHTAWFDFEYQDKSYRAAARRSLVNYVQQVYGVDFNRAFDWRAYKTNYQRSRG